MATARTSTQTWVARNGTLYIAPASAIVFSGTVALSGSFAGHFGTDITSAVKNITVTPPETSWEKQDFIGKDGSAFQDQLLDEKPVGIATVTATLILGEDETIEDMLSGTATVITGGLTRYQYGTDKTSEGEVTACVTLDSSDTGNINEISFAFDNAKFTKLGDTRISGPDSHWEQDITIICLPKDFYWEFKD